MQSCDDDVVDDRGLAARSRSPQTTQTARRTRTARRTEVGRAARDAARLGRRRCIGVFWWDGWDFVPTSRSKRSAQRSQFLQVARQGALNLTTIDWQKAESDVQRILDGATGQFYDDFAKRSQPFIDVVKKAKSTTVGTITEAGLESQTADSAQVLVAVTVTTSNAGAAAAGSARLADAHLRAESRRPGQGFQRGVRAMRWLRPAEPRTDDTDRWTKQPPSWNVPGRTRVRTPNGPRTPTDQTTTTSREAAGSRIQWSKAIAYGLHAGLGVVCWHLPRVI